MNFANCEILSKRFYHNHEMPVKDLVIKEAIESVMAMTQKGRNKIISMVLKLHPNPPASKIRRVYVRERISLPQRCRKRMKNNPANPIMVPFERKQEWAIDFMSDALVGGKRLEPSTLLITIIVLPWEYLLLSVFLPKENVNSWIASLNSMASRGAFAVTTVRR